MDVVCHEADVNPFVYVVYLHLPLGLYWINESCLLDECTLHQFVIKVEWLYNVAATKL